VRCTLSLRCTNRQRFATPVLQLRKTDVFTDAFMDEGRERVLVIFPGALGDLVCLLPTLRGIARRHCEAFIELMATPSVGNFFVGRAVLRPELSCNLQEAGRGMFFSVAEAYSIDRREVTNLFTGSQDGLHYSRGFFNKFAHVYSFFASQEPVFRRSLLQVVGGRASFARFCPADGRHIAQAYAAELGLNLNEDELYGGHPWVIATHRDRQLARQALESSKFEHKDFIVLMPGSGSPNKNWPAEKFAALARELHHRFGVVALLGPAEKGIRTTFQGTACTVMEGLELSTVAGLMSLAKAFVGNDSGVSHLAAALGVPGVVLFGPTEPSRWRPLGNVAVLHCRQLESLGVSQVLLALEQKLTSIGPLG